MLKARSHSCQTRSYVLAVATSTFFLNSYHAALTSGARRASGIKPPNAYASQELADKDPKAFAFNCGASPPPFSPLARLALTMLSGQPSVLTQTLPRT